MGTQEWCTPGDMELGRKSIAVLLKGLFQTILIKYDIVLGINNSSRPSDAYMRRGSSHHWFRFRLVSWSAPSHYLNQCWNIVNWTLGNKLQWNLNRNTNIFIQENAFESVVCQMAAILSRPQCVKTNSGGFCWHNARVRVPTGSPIPRPLGRIVRASPSALWQPNPTGRP